LETHKGKNMAMTADTIDHSTLERLVEAGAVRGASIVGQPGGWGVIIQYGMTERALAAKRGAMRIFRKFETLVAYLKGLGITRYQVDASQFDADATKTGRQRADASERMAAAHEAAAYDKCFRAEIAQAIAEADDPATEWVSNEEASASWKQKRAELVKRAESAG